MRDPAVVVLAAGRGERLRPLTDILPKPLCPVGNRALLDWALDRVGGAGDAARLAVNVHHGREAIEAHLAARPEVHVSVEADQALGTAGALGRLREWIDGRAVAVANSDAWGPTRDSVDRLLDGWDGTTVRVLITPDPSYADFADAAGRFAGISAMPWSDVAGLAAEPSGLFELVWRPAQQAGRLELVATDEPFFDCGTPAEYLAANLAWSGGESVVGEGAVVEGEIVRCVVWPHGVVRAGERLVDSIRAGADVTVAAIEGSARPGAG